MQPAETGRLFNTANGNTASVTAVRIRLRTERISHLPIMKTPRHRANSVRILSIQRIGCQTGRSVTDYVQSAKSVRHRACSNNKSCFYFRRFWQLGVCRTRQILPLSGRLHRSGQVEIHVWPVFCIRRLRTFAIILASCPTGRHKARIPDKDMCPASCLDMTRIESRTLGVATADRGPRARRIRSISGVPCHSHRCQPAR